MGSSLILTPSPRAQQVRSFLRSNSLLAWIAWRPDELLMLSGYFPFWGASLLVYLADANLCSSCPRSNRQNHIPAGLRVQEYPWGDLHGRVINYPNDMLRTFPTSDPYVRRIEFGSAGLITY